MKTTFSALLVIAIVTLGYFAFYKTGSAPENRPAVPQAAQINKAAEDTSPISNINELELYDANGKKYDMSQFADKNAVLFFNEGLMCYPSCWRQIAFFGSDPRFQKADIMAVAVVVDNPQDWQRGAVAKMPELGKTLTLFDKGGNASRKLGLLNVESSMHKGQYPGHSYLLVDKTGKITEVIDDPKMGINNDLIIEKIYKF